MEDLGDHLQLMRGFRSEGKNTDGSSRRVIESDGNECTCVFKCGVDVFSDALTFLT